MQTKSQRSGFTLVELLVTITIMAILMGLVVGLSGVARRKSTDAKAMSELQSTSTALEEYRLITGAYPATLAALTNAQSRLTQPLKEGVFTMDPWGRSYIYTDVTKYSFKLYSQGALTTTTDDDITTGSSN